MACRHKMTEQTEITQLFRDDSSATKRRSLEEEIMELNAISPEAVADLPNVFRKAVCDSLANVFGLDTAQALMIMIGDADMGNPEEVFLALDSFLKEGAEIMKGAIKAEFSVIVHQSLEKAEQGSLITSELAGVEAAPAAPLAQKR
jgi:hypothetical protein